MSTLVPSTIFYTVKHFMFSPYLLYLWFAMFTLQVVYNCVAVVITDKMATIYVVGYVVQGSNGEYAYLTTEERVEMVHRVRQMTPKDKLIIAGSGCECMQQHLCINYLFILYCISLSS